MPNVRSGFNIYFQKQHSSNGSRILSLVLALLSEQFCVSIVWSRDLTRVLTLFQILYISCISIFFWLFKLTSELCLQLLFVLGLSQCDQK